ncbi:hypothetical protein Acr_01g0006400 [Actinidia rufa]|uniref:Uncharacterized protein n=1 Tax=Actinidia rufa TaxID=165716 RepID=A0A7J0E2V1_9ERIC|nr:hypothetical protein Acr_01g0006400 [Actinidia rufa]
MISPEVAYLRTLLTEVKRVQRSARNLAKSSPLSSPEPPSECSSDRQELGYCLLLAIGRGKILRILEGSGGDFHLYMDTIHCEIFSTTIPTITGYSPDGNLPNYVSYISEISFHTYPSKDLAVIHGHGPLLRL